LNIYDEVNELLEPIDLTLDILKKFIQPTIFNGLKSNIESIKHTIKSHEERAKKVEDLLELYRSVHGVVQSWDTMPNVQKQIDVLEKELEELNNGNN
jgi:hypothetical protein